MLQISVGYFYQVRFLKPFQIPVSTAIWDPKWFHDWKSQQHKFVDKHGVLNGLRCEALHPHESRTLCHGRPCSSTPDSCEFLRKYRQEVFGINRERLIANFERIAEIVQKKLRFTGQPEIVLLVHEAPNNPCSERQVLLDFFRCQEFEVNRSLENDILSL